MYWDSVTVPLIVSNFDEAIGFYCHTLDQFEVARDQQWGPTRDVILDHKTCKFSLMVVPCYSDSAEVMGRQSGGASQSFLILPVKDCMALYEVLKGKGVRFEREPFDLPYGVQATCFDPFGNRICLSEMYPLDEASSS